MNAGNIRKLRTKFIAVAMLSLLLVMLFIGLAVNLTSFFLSHASIRRKLTGISSTGKTEDGYGVQAPTMSDIFSPAFDHNPYFVFTYKDENTVDVRSNTLNSPDEQDVKAYADAIYENKKTFGKKGSYYYLKSSNEEGDTIIALLNCATEIASNYRILFLTLAISFIALGIMFILIYRFSARMIRPEIENDRKQKEFITNASHELKTPLAVIRANTELLEITHGENEWTRSTLAQVDHVDGLIKNLVMIARSEEKEANNEKKTPFDASAAVQQTTETYESLAKQTQKSIKKNIEPNVSYVANEAKIRQLTTILLDNAMKYCDDLGTIEVSLCANGKNGMILTVSNDYAEGSSEDCRKFFDRFYRKDASHNIDKGGYGIGLSIAESICHANKGKISAEWKDGRISFICRLG